MEKRQPFQQMVLEKLDINVQNNEVGFLAYVKINSKWIKDLNIRPKPIKLLIENTREKLLDTEFGNDFLVMTPKIVVTKVNIDKLDCIKIKNFCASKDTVNTAKRQPA